MTYAWMSTVCVAIGLASLTGVQSDKPRVVGISAERFAFTPSRIEAEVGEPLEIRVKSDDTSHGFRILGTDVNVRVPKRGKGEVVVLFTPERVGRYTFECSRMCGAGHDFMRGELIVRERTNDSARR
jgi:cytochrome c oxidase subunit II